MKKRLSILFLINLLFSSCGPTQEEIDLMLADTVAAIPTTTPYPTYTVYPTQTPKIIIYTATIIPTQTITPTPTNTPIPYNKSQCRTISVPKINADADYEQEIRNTLNKYDGLCVRLYFEPWEYVDKTYNFGVLDNYLDSFDLDLTIDSETPTDIKIPNVFSKVWGVIHVPDNLDEVVSLAIRDVEEYPSNQQPINDDGLYEVGKNTEMYPGVWKSANDPTWTSECYWARINPSNGSIKDNHFGIAGMSVRVYEGDIFETNDECTSWYFVKP